MTDISTLDIFLMNYAAGTLSSTEALMMSAHLALKPHSREKVRQYEARGGVMVETENPSAITSLCFEKLMQKIDKTTPCNMAVNNHTKTDDCAPIPDAIFNLLCGNCHTKPQSWKKVSQGIDVMKLKLGASRCTKNLRLMRLHPSTVTPSHRHTGQELTLVLCGSFSDGTEIYKKGDIAIRTEKHFGYHQPRAGDQGCICLTLTDAPLQFEKPLYNFINLFLRF